MPFVFQTDEIEMYFFKSSSDEAASNFSRRYYPYIRSEY